jgi:hypothetical protein
MGQRARRKPWPRSQKARPQGLHRLDAVSTARAGCPTTPLLSVGAREAAGADVRAAPRPGGVALLRRASWHRCVHAPPREVWDPVAAQAVGAQSLLHVPRRGPPPAREATLTLHSCPWTLGPPQQRTAEGLPALTRWAVQVCEVEPPAEVEPLAGWLFTTVAVETVDDAIERVPWSACR